MKSDTIAAIATAMTPSGIGIVRISGDECLSIIDKFTDQDLGRKKSANVKVIPYIMVLYMMDRNRLMK